MEWNSDMGQAPSDHLLFYGNTRHDVGVVFTGWKAQNGFCYADNADFVKPTHWMSLPEPPAAKEGRG